MKKHWRSGLLALGLVMIAASFAAYGLRVAEAVVPAGASEAEIEELMQAHGFVGPLALQYRLFTYLFLPGMLVVTAWGTIAFRRPDPVEMPFARIYLAVMLLANGITAFNYLLAAPPLDAGFPEDFWLNMLLIGMLLAQFAFALVTWQGFKWGAWAFAITAVPLAILTFVGGIPLAAVCIGPLGLIIFYVVIKPVWVYMD
jgi:hypothetical protein